MFDTKWIIAIVAIGTWLYFYFQKKYSYWTNQGISGPKPAWVVGNVFQGISTHSHTYDGQQKEKYGKVFGTYAGVTPSLTICDPELVKQTIIKDFHYFTNRLESNAYHELWNKNLFSSNDNDWKRLRMITSPSFSSGKLRGMNPIMQRSIDKLNAYFERLSGKGSGVMETKKIIAGFTMDVISSTAFATETNANASDKEDPLVVNGRELFNISAIRGLSTFLLPKPLLRLFGVETFFPPGAFQFFIDLTTHILGQRRKGVTSARHDLIQLMMDASVDQKVIDQMNYDQMTASDEKEESTKDENNNANSSTKRKLTDNEIIANCIFFFIAGYETTASTLSHCIFELASNPDIQERLFADLNDSLSQFSSESSEEYFNVVTNQLPYLEAVMKETLRKYPPVSQMQRICSIDGYKLGKATLNKGDILNIATAAIHADPENWPEPERYDPERFMPENKDNLVPYSYLPFSLGPRNCVAMRFAYQEIRLCLASIVKKYKFSVTPETPAQLTFKKGSGLLIADPFNIKVTRR